MADEENSTRLYPKLTTWSHEPDLLDLKADYTAAREAHETHVAKVDRWADLMKVEGKAKPPAIKGRSQMQPKLIRRQAEWRYAPLSEPFLSSENLFKVSARTFEDGPAAKQNAMVLNYQFQSQFNRVQFIDNLVRSVVDEGTGIIKVGWEQTTKRIKQRVPVYTFYAIEQSDAERMEAFKQALTLRQQNPRGFNDQAPPEVKAAVDYFYTGSEETADAPAGQGKGVPCYAIETSSALKAVEIVDKNRPSGEVLNLRNVIIDPSANGDIDKAVLIIYRYETTKADCVAAGKRYKNLDKVTWETSTVLSNTDYATNTPDNFNMKGPRRKVVAYEYWGFIDIDGSDTLTPIVATWIGDTMIRMEENPFPDQKLPFIVIPYLPVKRELMGETDAELLEDNQKILGALMRGMIDLLGRSANAQTGIAKGTLDPLNRRRYDNGQDYEFNPQQNPQNNLIQHKYPDLPQSALEMMNIMNQEAESLTGVKAFAGGISGAAYGDVAAGIRGALDAASKREMSILRRVAKGVSEMGEKFASMNSAFLSDKETIRITNDQYVTFNRDELKGQFDFKIDIATAEVDDARAQELGFMLQTLGNGMDPTFTSMILAEIADLKRMPELARKIRDFKPQPNPLAEKQQELAIKELEAKIRKLDAEAKLAEAKADNTDAETQASMLETSERSSGVSHDRDMEKQRGQAEGNADLAVTNALLKARKADESNPDVEAAVGYNEIARQRAKPQDNSIDIPGLGGDGAAMEPAPDAGMMAPPTDPMLMEEPAPDVAPDMPQF